MYSLRKKFKKPLRRIYMDYAAGAPLLPVALTAMSSELKKLGNASAIYVEGVERAASLERSRAVVANLLSASPTEIVFVGSGTESNNLAISGVIQAARSHFNTPHIITTQIEHPAVLEMCRALEKNGVRVTYLGVDGSGLVHLAELQKALCPETVLVSIAYANNEVGTVQPVREIAKMLRHYRKSQSVDTAHPGRYPLFHTDACQAAANELMNVEQLGVDLLSFNGTKLGGPQGTGVLYVRRHTPLEPVMLGGGQEKNMRSGTENIAGCAGLAAAFSHMRQKNNQKDALKLLRDFFITEIKQRFPEARINGSTTDRLPNNVNISLPGFSSELLVLELDARGIAASAGSACASAKDAGSHVLAAIYGQDDQNEWGSVRCTFGYATTKKDVLAVVKALEAIREKYAAWRK